MHRAVAKIAANVVISRNLFVAYRAEREILLHRCGLKRSLWIPAAAVKGRARWIREPNRFIDPILLWCVRGREDYPVGDPSARDPRKLFKFNLVNFDTIGCTPLEKDSRYEFLCDVMNGRPYHQTQLFSRVTRGMPFRRRVDRATSSDIEDIVDDESFRGYYDFSCRLVESIRRDGLLDLESPEDPATSTIGVAVGRQGEILHHNTGGHRMVIAKLLDLDRIPVRIQCISGEYFRNFARGSDAFSEERLLRAVSAAAESAQQTALANA